MSLINLLNAARTIEVNGAKKLTSVKGGFAALKNIRQNTPLFGVVNIKSVKVDGIMGVSRIEVKYTQEQGDTIIENTLKRTKFSIKALAQSIKGRFKN